MDLLKKQLLEKGKESLFSVLPISIIVIVLSLFLPLGKWNMIGFIIGAFMLIIGLSLFTLGADVSMMNVGLGVGKYIAKKRNLWILLLVPFLIGMLITIAEPDLLVLAKQVSIPDYVLIISVAAGVGIFLTVALLRVVLNIDIRVILVVCYIIAFVLASFIPKELVPISFDSGGVTTGPMTVPFIMALGLGVASMNRNSSEKDNSFGYVALSSIGPIIAVLILSLCTNIDVSQSTNPDSILNFAAFSQNFWQTFASMLKEVALALTPIIIFVIIFEIIIFKENKKTIIKLFIGLGYAYIGLVLFLTGANIGFMPIGNAIGSYFGNHSNISWILIPLGMVMGFFVVMAEPAVHVLNNQVEDVTGGAISKKLMLFSLAIGVAISIGLAMSRVIFDYSIWWVILPGYAIALILTLIVPKIFSVIAFDSGGVASGPMTATFLLPLATGACNVLYEGYSLKILENGFGIVALVAMTPLIVIQLLGLVYKIKTIKARRKMELPYEDIIDFDVDLNPEIMYE